MDARPSCADAARHAVLRRLGPALKHDMVVYMQAVSMMTEMLHARLERGAPPPAELQATVGKLNRLARDAVLACLRAATWIEPGEDETVALHEGVAECVALLAGGFNFRGIVIANEVAAGDFEVARNGLRDLLAAALLTLADDAEPPAQLRIAARLEPAGAVLTVTCGASAGEAPRQAMDPPEPRLQWGDVQALAAAEAAELARSAGQIVLRLARAQPTTPLRMAPV